MSAQSGTIAVEFCDDEYAAEKCVGEGGHLWAKEDLQYRCERCSVVGIREGKSA